MFKLSRVKKVNALKQKLIDSGFSSQFADNAATVALNTNLTDSTKSIHLDEFIESYFELGNLRQSLINIGFSIEFTKEILNHYIETCKPDGFTHFTLEQFLRDYLQQHELLIQRAISTESIEMTDAEYNIRLMDFCGLSPKFREFFFNISNPRASVFDWLVSLYECWSSAPLLFCDENLVGSVIKSAAPYTYTLSNEKKIQIRYFDCDENFLHCQPAVVLGLGIKDLAKKRLWFHGTCSTYARSVIQEGIEISFCRPHTDFGQSFYLTEDYRSAAEFAKQRQLSSSYPAVLVYGVIDDEYATFNHQCWDLQYIQQKDEWARFVRHCRFKKPWKKFEGSIFSKMDSFFGPEAHFSPQMVVNSKWVPKENGKFQLALKSDAICDFFNKSLVGCIVFYQNHIVSHNLTVNFTINR